MGLEKKERKKFIEEYQEKLTTCPKCGGELSYLGVGYYRCKECGEEIKDRFCQIKEYLEEHPKATAFEVSNALNIELSYINRLLRAGRLEITETSDVFIQCEICGAPIRYGRVCAACAAANKKIQGVTIAPNEVGESPKKHGESMHFLNQEKKHF